MNANSRKVVITVICATVIVIFLVLFSQWVTVDLNAPLVHLKLAGSNQGNPPAGVKGKDLDAGTDITARDKTGNGVDVEHAKAQEGSITLENESPPGGPPAPKR